MPTKGRHLKQRMSSITKAVPGLQQLKQIFIINCLDTCPRLSLQPGVLHNVPRTFLFHVWASAGGHQPSLSVCSSRVPHSGNSVVCRCCVYPNLFSSYAFGIWPWSFHERRPYYRPKCGSQNMPPCPLFKCRCWEHTEGRSV